MPETPKTATTRASHTKSRAGCVTCKARRVKCDEARPICGSCSRRKLDCRYNTAGSPHVKAQVNGLFENGDQLPTRQASASRQSPLPASRKEQSGTTQSPDVEQQRSESSLNRSPLPQSATQLGAGTFDAFDMKLLYHFLNILGPIFVRDGRNAEKWKSEIPEIAFAHQSVLHALLAVSAMHLCRQLPLERHAQVKAKAAGHFAHCLPALIESSHNISESDSNALFATTMFVLIYHFASGPHPGQYIGFSDQGEVEAMSILRGMRTMSETAPPEVLTNWQLKTSVTPDPPSQDGQSPSRNSELLQEARQQILRLRHHVAALRAESHHFEKYITAIDSLEESFTESLKTTGEVASAGAMAWLYRMTPELNAALQEKLPLALVVFAYFTVLLSQVRIWYLEGWSAHIMNGICNHLHSDYKHWLEWPLSVTNHANTAEHPRP